MAARHRPRARWFVLVVVAVVVASIAGYAVGSTVRSPEDVLASAKPPAESLLTVEVRRGSVESSESFTGKAEWRSTVTVEVPPSGGGLRSVVTRTPLAVGQQLRSGFVLVEISDRPVIVLAGAVPMLRDLRLGDVGADVSRLQAGLGIATDGVFGERTLAALRDRYVAAGYAMPQESVATGPGESRGGKSRGGSRRRGYVSASEIVFVPTLPATLLKYAAEVGSAVPDPVAEVGVGGVVVRTKVPASWRARLRPESGRSAGIRIRAGRGRAHDGVVGHVGAARVVEGRGDVVPVTIRPRRAGALDVAAGTEVEVTLTDRAAPKGLLVPLAALYTAADQGDFVRVVRDGAPVRVPVRIKDTGAGVAVVAPDVPGELVVHDEVVVGVDRRQD